MCSSKKASVHMGAWLVICGLLLLALGGGIGRAESTDGFISDAGIFDYLTRPDHLPQTGAEPSQGWVGTFYAPGVGLEAAIRGDSEREGVYYCDLYNYSAADMARGMEQMVLQAEADGSLSGPNGDVRLYGLKDGSFTMEFSPEYLQSRKDIQSEIYQNPASVAFQDVTMLMGQNTEDNWGGAYLHDVMRDYNGIQVYDDLTLYISLVRLYGTSDYFVISQREQYGQEVEGFMVREFVTESQGALIHDYGVSVVTGENYTVHYRMDAQGNITCDAGDDGSVTQYRRCSTKPMWGD